MKIFFVLLAACAAMERPNRLVLVSRSIGVPPALSDASPITLADRSVSGLCSAAQDSLGQLTEAKSSGISTLAQCAQFARDKAGSAAVFVSFDQSSCMWFADCRCLVTSSVCLGGDQWRSVAISDVISSTSSPNVIQTKDAPVSKSALVTDGPTVAPATAEQEAECDSTYSSNLMRTFQSKCEMTQNVWTTRIIAGGTLLGVVLLIAGAFGLAYWFDRQELQTLLAAGK
jgi:hypothetical protein